MGTHDFYMESGNVSLFKKGEELCGDMVEKIYHDDAYTLVLADGLGSGVKANVLSTLTSKIIGTMMADGQPIEDCVATIVETLPVCSVRQVAYSTFTILQVRRNGNTSTTPSRKSSFAARKFTRAASRPSSATCSFS